jgi:hypothetical protein
MTKPKAVGALVVGGSVAAGLLAGMVVACSPAPNATPDASPDARARIDAPAFVPADAGSSILDDANCVPPGTASNAAGVGGYCSPGGGQCANAGRDGSVAVCTADFNVPAHAWFCTIACTSASQCGTGGASCVPSIHGQACIPAACVRAIGDPSDGAAADASSPDAG